MHKPFLGRTVCASPRERATSNSANLIECTAGEQMRAWSPMATRKPRARMLTVLLRSPYPAVETSPAL
jgi:hypothetical protein